MNKCVTNYSVQHEYIDYRVDTPAVCSASSAFDDWLSGLLCSWPEGLKLATDGLRHPTRSFDGFRHDLKIFLSQLACTAHWRIQLGVTWTYDWH